MPSAAGGSAPRCGRVRGRRGPVRRYHHALYRDEVVGHEKDQSRADAGAAAAGHRLF